MIDLDPQGNASTALAIEHPRGTPSSYDVLVDGAPLAEVSQLRTRRSRTCVVVPATIDLAGAEIELVSVVARENRLRRAIAAHPRIGGEGEDRFDYVFVDCPPSLGLLTLNALVAGAEMLIPIQAEYYALEGLGQLLETVEMVQAHLNAELEVSTILLTMYDSRTNLAAGVAGEVREHFADQVLRTAIPRSVRVSEAPSYGQSVITYDPGSPGALCYLEAARELALRGRPGRNGMSPNDHHHAEARPRPRARLADPARRRRSRRLRRRRRTTRPAQRGFRRCAAVAVSPGSPGDQAEAHDPVARSVLRRDPGRGRSRPTRGSRARSSTRTRWPSWCTRCGRSDCSSRSSYGAPGDVLLRAGDGRAALAGHPRGRPRDHPGDRAARPTTTTCSATRCWRTCTAPS